MPKYPTPQKFFLWEEILHHSILGIMRAGFFPIQRGGKEFDQNLALNSKQTLNPDPFTKVTQTLINRPPPLNRDCNRDPYIKALKRRGFINHGSTLFRSSPQPFPSLGWHCLISTPRHQKHMHSATLPAHGS